MAERTLGILVTSEEYLDYVFRICEAAGQKGISIQIFFTGSSVNVIRDHRFPGLCRMASISVCEANYRGSRKESMTPGGHLLSTHAKNAQMVKDCDRYLVF